MRRYIYHPQSSYAHKKKTILMREIIPTRFSIAKEILWYNDHAMVLVNYNQTKSNFVCRVI